MPERSKHWNYFLAVEADLMACSRYVEFAQPNFSCYSNEFAKLIILAGAEVDSILGELSEIISPGCKAGRITDYFPVVSQRFPKITQVEVSYPRFDLHVQPWDGWTAAKGPDWWSKSYNKLKHVRHDEFNSATLEAALKAVGSQFLMLQLYHLAKFGEDLSVEVSERNMLVWPRIPNWNKGGVFWAYGDPFDSLNPPPSAPVAPSAAI